VLSTPAAALGAGRLRETLTTHKSFRAMKTIMRRNGESEHLP
jgi:hypothetical protein